MEQLKLNMIPNGVNPVFHASQYDKGRQIRFVLDETLSSAEVTVSYRAKDGTEHGNVQPSVSGNTITDTIPEEVLTDYGIIEGEVSIDGIGSLNFFVEVEKDAYDGGVITTQTASGAIATFETNIETAFVSLKSDINPVQDLHGYSKPWSGGGGKNKLNYDAWKTVSVVNGTATFENNGVTLTATSNDCYTSAPNGFPVSARIPVTEGETITLSWEENTNQDGSVYIFPNGTTSGMVRVYNQLQKYASYTATSGVTFIAFRFGVSNSGVTISYKNIQIEKGSQATSWEPYENICPISGFSALNVTLADGDMQPVDTKTVNFGQTVYGGVADVTNGKVTITKIAHVFDGSENFLTLASGRVFAYDFGVNLVGSFNNNNSFCSHFHEGYGAWDQLGVGEYLVAGVRYGGMNPDMTLADYRTYLQAQYNNGTPVILVATLATPTEIDITAENLTAISGENNVYSDTNGDTEVEYYIEV